MKELYSFNVYKTVEKTVKEKQTNDKNETVEISKTVKEKVPVRIILKKPSRVLTEEGDMFYSLTISQLVKKGYLTKAMLAKQYGDVGGYLTDEQKKHYGELYIKLYDSQMELEKLQVIGRDNFTEKEEQKEKKLKREVAEAKAALINFESAQSSLFDHTADVIARNKTIVWYALHLTNIQEGEDDNAETYEMFKGKTYEEKYDEYIRLDEEEDEIYSKAISKLSTALTLWYLGNGNNQETIDAAIQNIEKEVEEIEGEDEE